MSNYPNPTGRPYEMEYDAQADSSTISTFFNSVYAWMAAGLALTAVVAWWTWQQGWLMDRLFTSPGSLIILFIIEIGLVIAISGAINKIGAGVATVLFLLYAAINGLTLSVILLFYQQGTIALAFGITAGTFAAFSIFGFVTKRDLSTIGSICYMGLIGVLIASLVSWFWPNGMLVTIINYVGVLVFVGLTAYDTQKLKMIAVQTADNPAMAARLSISGALMLYLDFINLFLFILRILGSKRD